MRVTAAGAAVALFVTLGPRVRPDVSAAAAASALPLFGCPMAHCDPQMTDLVKLPPPSGDVGVVWHRLESAGEIAGSRLGLGCSGNGQITACTFSGEAD